MCLVVKMKLRHGKSFVHMDMVFPMTGGAGL